MLPTLRNALLAAALAALPLLAAAKEAAPAAEDPALEAKMQAITAELRCLVCQNQTIADSHADLAVDLRNQVRQMLREGKSQQEIIDYMTARYGDFVLYRPPVKGTTLLLAGALLVLMRELRRRQRLGDEAFDPDTPDDDDAPAPLR